MPGRRSTRKRDLLAIGAAVIFLLAAVYAGARWLETRSANPEPRGDHTLRYADEQITVNGAAYRLRQNLTTILLMGIDQESGQNQTGNFRSGGQADFLRLVVVDPAEKAISQIQIDRDAMTPVPVLDVLGSRSGRQTMQICLSHGFGDGKEQSCLLTAEAVSDYLLHMPVDHYAAMNLDGISVLNDALGGVTVTLEDDFSSLDPAMTQGTTLTLRGKQAEYFVRSRREIGDGSNEVRMRRQQAYISQLTDLLLEKVQSDERFIGELFDLLAPYLITDVSRAEWINDAWAWRNYSRRPLSIPEGTHTIGESGFMEFRADEKSLQQIVLNLFCKEIK